MLKCGFPATHPNLLIYTEAGPRHWIRGTEIETETCTQELHVLKLGKWGQYNFVNYGHLEATDDLDLKFIGQF